MDCRNKRRIGGKSIKKAILLLIAAVILIPVLIPIISMFLGYDESARTLGGVLENGEGYASLVLFPAYPTFQPLQDLFLFCTEFYDSFWNTVLYAGVISAMQLLIGMPAAWAFGQYDFKGKRILFGIYLLMMMLPFQVTMVSNYLLFYQVSLLNTVWVILLPGIFSTFPVFLMTNFFRAVPKEIIEAARVDGAGEFRIFWRIGVPVGKSGVAASFILNFIEYWNMIEQPLAFLEDKSLKPISLFLPAFNQYTAGSIFAASVATMILPILIFLWGKKYLEEGIACLAIKK